MPERASSKVVFPLRRAAATLRQPDFSTHRTPKSGVCPEFLPQEPFTLNVAGRFRNERLKQPGESFQTSAGVARVALTP